MILHANTTALLLQDLQNDLLKGSRSVLPSGSETLIANCRKLQDRARALKIPVIQVRLSRRRHRAGTRGLHEHCPSAHGMGRHRR